MTTSGMSHREKERVHSTFVDAARDLSPPSLRPDVTVLFLPADEEQCAAKFYSSVVSGEELGRAARFKNESDRMRFIKGRGFRRYCGAVALGNGCSIDDVRFEETESGRPLLRALPGTAFSFSGSTQGHIAAWSSRHDVGVDIEDPGRRLDVLEMAQYHYGKAEVEFVARASHDERRRIFVRLWALKEAALKSVGEGIGYGLDAFQFTLEPALRMVVAPQEHGSLASYRADLIDGLGENAVAALCLRCRI